MIPGLDLRRTPEDEIRDLAHVARGDSVCAVAMEMAMDGNGHKQNSAVDNMKDSPYAHVNQMKANPPKLSVL